MTALDRHMPGWLTAESALWCLTVLAVIGAVCGIVLYLGDRGGAR